MAQKRRINPPYSAGSSSNEHSASADFSRPRCGGARCGDSGPKRRCSTWKDEILNYHQTKWNPAFISEPARRVVATIREKYGMQSGTPTPRQNQTCRGSDCAFRQAPRRQLDFGQPSPSNVDRISHREPPSSLMRDQASSCTLDEKFASANAQRLSVYRDESRERQNSSHLDTENLVPDIRSITLPAQRKRTVQQAPITDFFQECKNKQECRETKKRRETPVNWGCANQLISVTAMTDEERVKVKTNLSVAEEVACSLLYEDNYSSLRPKKRQKQGRESGSTMKVDVANAAEAVGVALPWREERNQDKFPSKDLRLAFVKIPLSVQDPNLSSWCKTLLRNLMESKTRKICYDAQSFVRSLLQTGSFDTRKVYCSWTLLDPKVAAWMLDPDHPPQSFTNLLQSMNLAANNEQNSEDMERCFCQDIAMLGPLMMTLYNRLKADNLWQLFAGLESHLCPILAGMDLQEIGIDVQVLLEASHILKKKIGIVEAEAYKLAGHSFLINSPLQLRKVLFEELKLDKKCNKKLARTTIMNQKSTSEAVLMQLQELHPLPKIVLQYRHLIKLRSTYFNGILSHVKQGFLHTNWEQTAAATGRLSCANPNLQAIPKQPVEVSGIKKQYVVGKEEETVTIFARDAYKSREGWLLLAADFQSMELRLLAHLSDDPSLLRIFQDPGCSDVFTTLTADWLGKAPDVVEQHERERTKRIVYSVVYGVGSEKLGHTLSVTVEEAKGFMASFMGRFPGINAFTKRCLEHCRRQGYVCSILNRRRLLPNINAADFALRSQAERQAVNFVVQGSAADLCKAAMIQVVRSLNEDGTVHTRLLLQIHDELLFEVPEEEIGKVKRIVKSTMESTDKLCAGEVRLKVPFPVSLSVGKTWGHMQPCDG